MVPLIQPPLHAQTSDSSTVAGDWQGALDAGGATLRIVFHIKSDENGALTATMDSPDQGATGIPVTTVTLDGNRLTIDMPPIGGRYVGTLDDAQTSAEGTWSQSGMTLPLTLGKTDKPAEVNRPQEPRRPYPYEEEEVVFSNNTAGVQLAGTLTLPRSAGPHPAAVLISGSGPQNRNEELMGHKPFLVLADHLTRKGIAVLRYDDRGVGASTGDRSMATIDDFTRDAMAAVTYLKTRPEIAADRIGLIGHSEGGLVAPIVASQSDDVAFVVLLAGPGLPGKDILMLQSAAIARAGGMPEAMIEKTLHVNETLYDAVIATPSSPPSDDRLRAVIVDLKNDLTPEEIAALGLSDDRAEQIIRPLTSPWLKHFLSYDPRPTLGRVRVPMISLIGEKDLQVPPQENTRAIQEATKDTGHPDNDCLILPGLNHLFQTAQTGSPSEYGRIEETFAPHALSTISDWIVERVNAP